jgi:hypothetical protein
MCSRTACVERFLAILFRPWAKPVGGAVKTVPSPALPIRVTSNSIAAYLPSFARLQRAVETVRQGDVIHLDVRPGR